MNVWKQRKEHGISSCVFLQSEETYTEIKLGSDVNAHQVFVYIKWKFATHYGIATYFAGCF